jgi:hypothetical protein
VIKMLVRVAPPTEQVSLWRIEKASSTGVEQMVMLHNETKDNIYRGWLMKRPSKRLGSRMWFSRIRKSLGRSLR